MGELLVKENVTQVKVSNFLKNTFDDHCAPFKFIYTIASGLQGMNWFVGNMGKGNLKKVLFGYGSYLTGDIHSFSYSLNASCTNINISGHIVMSDASELAKACNFSSLSHSMHNLHM
mmetsp:Transcript_18714/g.27444  ORF Transcript_18714/g.27444 Transcript_18714/m.27444 type:complete len:117 (-) Transcript_18714:1341-1691(-)